MGGDKIEKITIMVLKVDLQCLSCYKKVKKVLCKFPQIRDPVYDEKANSVTIKVFCCNPEKIRDKLCYEGGGVIQSIEIKEPKKSEPQKSIVTEPKKTPETGKTNPKKTEDASNKPTPVAPTPQPQPQPQPQIPPVIVMQIQGYPHHYPPAPEPVIVMPIQEYLHQLPPGGNCCEECYQGYSGGPCYHHERPITSIEIKEPPKPIVREPKQPPKPIVPEPKQPIEHKPEKTPKKPEESPKLTPAPTPVAPPPQPQIPPVIVMQIQGYPHQYPPAPEPVIVMPIQEYLHQLPPGGYCCEECYQGYSGGPCYHHERPIQPPPPAPCYSYGYGPGPVPYGHPKGCYVNKCDYYFSEENASGCSIM